ncbi:MAG: hypothetical protein MZU91_12255 [Desulfosudis oleivorans]|nr:hypothetical protein [Desulfosudis oleivorans]
MNEAEKGTEAQPIRCAAGHRRAGGKEALAVGALRPGAQAVAGEAAATSAINWRETLRKWKRVTAAADAIWS